MITILMVLTLNLGNVEVVVDMAQLYDTQNVDECRALIPEMLQLYQAKSAYCAVGGILNSLEKS
jgi:hypothetical protein